MNRCPVCGGESHTTMNCPRNRMHPTTAPNTDTPDCEACARCGVVAAKDAALATLRALLAARDADLVRQQNVLAAAADTFDDFDKTLRMLRHDISADAARYAARAIRDAMEAAAATPRPADYVDLVVRIRAFLPATGGSHVPSAEAQRVFAEAVVLLREAAEALDTGRLPAATLLLPSGAT